MRVRYFAWFDSKQERTEFINLLRSAKSDIDAVNKVMQKYPELTLSEVSGIVNNFKKEINQP
jgi:hypothetical protein